MATTPYQLSQRLRIKSSSNSPSLNASTQLSILKDKPFWIWDKQEHKLLYSESNGSCCFNHCLGFPIKDNTEFPLFDYEELLYKRLFTTNKDFKDKHLWLLKATGLGATEFFLRYCVVMHSQRWPKVFPGLYSHRS
jgi:hypothetical protein